ncbi:solute carrier family 2, facilitated glucose transporter member 1-like [Ambystoma mexicanum]|uniref:solute carrier family 2, facilitated glucose transporter member 1-like n=1 Tax=Ambystoma mexicanum TaxID=8296 RepID=UPI0037E8A127
MLKGKEVTWTLINSVFSSVLASLQIGYHTGNINTPQMIIEEFYNDTWWQRHERHMSHHTLTMLWSLTVSILSLGATVSALCVGLLADNQGRRGSILIANSIALFAIVCMGISKLATSPEMLIIGRFVMGLYCGLSMTLVPLYIQEIAPTHLRGAFSTMNQLAYTIGIFIGQIMSLESVLGTREWWPVMLTLSLIPTLIQFLTFPFCPESPRYLLINCNEEILAEKELQKLRGKQDVMEEIKEMKEEAARLRNTPEVTICQLFRVPSYRKPMVISLLINASSQLSGYNALINYSTKLFTLAKVASPTYTTMGVGVINIVFTIIAVFLVENAGRRTLLLIGFFALAVCDIVLTVSIATLSELRWMSHILVLAVFVFVAFFEIGPGPIAWYITAELFGQSARPVAMGVASSWNWLNKFFVGMFYQPLQHAIGPYVFLCFAIILMGSFVYTWFRVPETRGRTFEEITAEFRQADGLLMNKL